MPSPHPVPNKGTCAGCGREDTYLYGPAGQPQTSCADCERRRIRSTPFDGETCDDCGNKPAFRDPATRENIFRCAVCHGKTGYFPTERSKVSQAMARVSKPHPLGTKLTCIAAGRGTDCKGEIKQRGQLGLLCLYHFKPKVYK